MRCALRSRSRTPHVTVGIHTVISRLNVDRFPEIYRELKTLEPDSYITEVAEERVELKTIGKAITPSAAEYAAAADYLIGEMRRSAFDGTRWGASSRRFRLEYYQPRARSTSRSGEQIIPCYAGWASAQIAPDGYVWGCCVRAESVGSLRENGYDFGRVWFSPEADRFRRSVATASAPARSPTPATRTCSISPRALARVARNWIA